MKRQAALIFVLSTLMLDAMGIALIMPVMPDLLQQVQGVGVAQAALWGGVLTTSFAVMQFLFSPVVGALSDRFGRRPILLISLVVLALDYALMAMAQTIWLLLLGRVIAGLAAATYSTAAAFMADVSPPEKRAQNFGLIQAAFGIGFVVGPVIGGFLGEIGPRAPFVAAGIVASLSFVLGYFLFEESLAPEKRRPIDWARANPLGSLMKIGELPGAQRLLSATFLYDIANYVYPVIWSYFVTQAFGWEPRMIGYSLAAYGISLAVVQAGLIRIILRYLGDARTLYWGLVVNIGALALFGLASEPWMIWAIIPFASLGAVVTPALTGILSRQADESQQGELQGVLASLSATGMILSPVIFTQAFFWFTRDYAAWVIPGAPFLVASLLMALSFAIVAQKTAR